MFPSSPALTGSARQVLPPAFILLAYDSDNMADWDEIKRLAADLQRAQLSSTVQRLSENNCHEIVKRLVEAKQLEILHTNDGKEYITPQELGKEIREELQHRGGRVNLVDLQQALNVDLNHIESKVNDIVKADRSLSLVLGQIVDRQYFDAISEEINEDLQEQGHVSMADLTKQYDLPGDFISQGVKERLGTTIKGRMADFDPDTIFTQSFLNMHKARIRGTFSAVTRPINIVPIIHKLGIQEKLFYSILEDLIACKRLAGSISGMRKEKAQYIPEIYTRKQNQWVDAFYKQNGYLEYASLQRLGISDGKAYIQKRLKRENLMYLSSCCVGKLIQEQLEAQLDEAIATVGWLDVTPHLPSILTSSDIGQILQNLLKSKSGVSVLCDAIIASNSFVETCSKPFDKLMTTKAEKDARTNPTLFLSEENKGPASKVVLDDGGAGKEENKEKRRKKAATGKAGGGTQGREGKTKSTKKKYVVKGKDSGSDEDVNPTRARSNEIEFMSVEEIHAELKRHTAVKECPDELLEAVAERLHRPLRRQYQPIAKSIFLQQTQGTSSATRKKTHDDLSDKINGLWVNAKLFEKGMKLFNEETAGHLCRHLLKTVCTDITNLVFNAIAADHMLSVQDEATITPEARLKLLGQMPDDKTKDTLIKLHGSLNGKVVEDFFAALESMCASGKLEILLKKPDKKKERQIVFSHRQALASQLREEEDPAMVLHLAAALLVHLLSGSLVHAPGRCVPQLITYLKPPALTEEQHDIMMQCQENVVNEIKLQSAGDAPADDIDKIKLQLKELVPKVKDIALTFKKPSGANKEED